jgi:fucose permease
LGGLGKMHTRDISLEEKKEDKRYPATLLTLSIYLLMLAYALSVTMISPLMPILISQYGLKLSEGGLIMTSQSIGGVLAIILGAVITDLVKKSKSVFITFFIYSLSLVLLAVPTSYPVLLALFFILGASTRLLDALVNAFISDIHYSRRGTYLGLLHASFGIGAFIGPLFAASLINQGISWNITFLILGIVCLLIILVYCFIVKNSRYEEKPSTSFNPKEYLGLIFSPKLLIICITMFVYCGHQWGISTWLPMYMEDFVGSEPIVSSIALSVLWVGIIAGRLISSYMSPKVNIKVLLASCSLAAGIFLAIGFIINTPFAIILFSGLTGLLTGSIIPMLVLIACNQFPQNSGAVSSMIFLYGTYSRMLFPWLIGLIAETFNFHWGMMVTSVTLLITAAFSLVLPSEKREGT